MTTPTTATTPPIPATAAERRRDSLFLLARIRIGEESGDRDVRVRNLSEGGLMAEYDGRAAAGDPVTIELRGVGEVAGQIAWAEHGRIGVSFDRAIDPKAARKPVGSRQPLPAYVQAPPRR